MWFRKVFLASILFQATSSKCPSVHCCTCAGIPGLVKPHRSGVTLDGSQGIGWKPTIFSIPDGEICSRSHSCQGQACLVTVIGNPVDDSLALLTPLKTVIICAPYVISDGNLWQESLFSQPEKKE